MEPTAQIVDFASRLKFEDIPLSSVRAAKREVLDILGTTLAGNLAPACSQVVSLAEEWGGAEESTILGYGRKVPSPFAALANGTMAHAWDFDDTHDRAVLHAGVSVIPAALAAGEKKKGVRGKDFLSAVVLGIELVCRMGMATKYGPNTTGWMLTSLYGYFGAALAAGKILDLDREKMHNALGITYAQAAGNVQCVLDGALTKRMQAGFASQGGIMAALLAEKGVTGAKEVIQGKFGFFNVYQRGDYDPEPLVAGLGEKFAVEDLSFKPYPCCRFVHSTLDGAIKLFREKSLPAQEIQEVSVSVNQQALTAVCLPLEVKSRPRTVVDAQFSIPYAAAAALVKGKVGLEDFNEKALSDPRVLALAQRVKPRLDPEMERAGSREISPSVVEIKSGKGEVYSQRIDIPKGHPRNPMTDDELAAKFKDCARHAASPLGEKDLDEIVKLVYDLEGLDDLSRVVQKLNGARRKAKGVRRKVQGARRKA